MEFLRQGQREEAGTIDGHLGHAVLLARGLEVLVLIADVDEPYAAVTTDGWHVIWKNDETDSYRMMLAEGKLQSERDHESALSDAARLRSDDAVAEPIVSKVGGHRVKFKVAHRFRGLVMVK